MPSSSCLPLPQGFTRSFMWWTVAILVAFILGFRLASLLAISRLTFQRR